MSGTVPVLARCRLCESDRFVVIATEQVDGLGYSIVRCRDCGLVYVREVYEGVSPEYVALEAEEVDEDRILLQTAHKEHAMRESFRRFERILGPGGGRRLLSVGCGVGDCLHYAPSHYELFGFDSSAAQIGVGVSRFTRIRCATSLEQYREQVPDARDPFDIMTMWDVLEHLREPLPFVRSLARGLGRGGLIFVSVPAAWPMRVKSRLPYWRGGKLSWSPREHVTYFSPRTLRSLFRRAGLEVVELGSVPVYPRPLTAFEVARRAFFLLTRFLPGISPQIYAVARLP